MATYRQIIIQESDGRPGRVLIPRAKWCNRFSAKLRGFTFRRQLPAGEGLVLVEGKDSRVNTAIHMLFVFFPLGVIWVNDAGRVVDKVLAKPWRLSYAPQAAARYVIEGHPSILDNISIGDTITFNRSETNGRMVLNGVIQDAYQ